MHRIREKNGEVKEIDCELGTGIRDKNFEEIFEGDSIQIAGFERPLRVVFDGGEFWLEAPPPYEGRNNRRRLNDFFSKYISRCKRLKAGWLDGIKN